MLHINDVFLTTEKAHLPAGVREMIWSAELETAPTEEGKKLNIYEEDGYANMNPHNTNHS